MDNRVVPTLNRVNGFAQQGELATDMSGSTHAMNKYASSCSYELALGE